MGKRHKCSVCVYFFKGLVATEKGFYNALSDRYCSSAVIESVPGCGYSEGAVVLDKDQPRCHNFMSKYDNTKIKQMTTEELRVQFESMFEEDLEREGAYYKDEYVTEGWKCYLVCASNNKVIKGV